MKNLKKFIVAAMAFASTVFITAAQPCTASADDTSIQCGDNVYATLDTVGHLTISGTGDMWSNETINYFSSIANDIYTVTIEDGVTSIGDYSFTTIYNYNAGGLNGRYGLSNLQSVDIGNTVESIGVGAFYDNDQLTDIDIPSSVATIGNSAFSMSGLKTCKLHEGLLTIGESAFTFTSLTNINIPDNISSIESNAFANISSINVTIPEHIAIIKANAFSGTRVSATVKSMDVVIGTNAFGYNPSIKANRGSTAENYCINNPSVSLSYIQYKSVLTLNPAGGKVSPAKKNVLSETYYRNLPAPTRKGYIFAGWYTKANGGKKIKSDTLITTRVNSTLYAHWTKIALARASKPSLSNKSGKAMAIKLTKVSKANGYQIQYSLKSNMNGAKSVTTSSRSYTVKGLKLKKAYYVRARAYRNDSTGKKVYGDWSNTAKIKITK